MDPPSKNNEDCYFYYYSSCSKGDQCFFRHEPTALGSETGCVYWQQGQCKKAHCSFRHMELKQNRNHIPCYWEAQPTGCLKAHCPFMHNKSKDKQSTVNLPSKESITNLPSPPEVTVNGREENEQQNKNAEGETTESASSVSRVVVSLGEESDGESLPPVTPSKKRGISPELKIKSLEEIRLERIQREDAAVYSYPQRESKVSATPAAKQLFSARNRLGKKENIDYSKGSKPSPKKDSASSDFHVKTLDEIRAERNGLGEPNDSHETTTDSFSAALKSTTNNSLAPDAKQSTTPNSPTPAPVSTQLDYKPRKLKVKRSADVPSMTKPTKLRRVAPPQEQEQKTANPVVVETCEAIVSRVEAPKLIEVEEKQGRPVPKETRDSIALEDSLWDEDLGDDNDDGIQDDDLLLEIDNMLGT